MSADQYPYAPLKVAVKYLHHYLSASNGSGHGIHSPFVFQFIRDVLKDQTAYPEYGKAESLRRQMLADRELLEVEDLGAGAVTGTARRRKVSSIARHSAKSPRLARLLFRLVRHYAPASIIELGTSLGITTSYLALAGRGVPVFTFEGCGATADKAAHNFEQLELSAISLERGNFDEKFPAFIRRRPQVDFLYVDGNHRREPTLHYFRTALSGIHNDSIIVFDDIHWSRQMEQAWEEICGDPAVRCSLDLFWLGIVFFRREFHQKQHFSIRF